MRALPLHTVEWQVAKEALSSVESRCISQLETQALVIPTGAQSSKNLQKQVNLLKLEQTKAFTKKLRLQQKTRELHKEKELATFQERIQQEQVEAERLSSLQAQLKTSFHDAEVQRLREKAFKRRKHTKKLSEFVHQMPTDVPLYRKIEQKYIDLKVIPELQRRKEVLASKRQKCAPVRINELAYHMKVYQYYKEERELQRAVSREREFSTVMPPTKYKELILKDREEKQQRLQPRVAKLELIKKQQKYGVQVKEFHTPKVRKPRQISEKSIKRAVSRSPVMAPRDSSAVHSHSQRKTSSASTLQKLQPPQVRYLDTRREIRKQLEQKLLSDLNPELDKISSLNISKQFEKQAWRKQSLLKGLYSMDPYNVQLINAEEKVDDFILKSISHKAASILNHELN